MRDETHDVPSDDVINRNRAEAFAAGYRQALGDVQGWRVQLPAIPSELLEEKLKENADRYGDFADSFDRIRKGIREAEMGLTVDRGDFTQYLADGTVEAEE